MTNEEVREIYRKIATGERRHGTFLTHYAEAVIRADPENFALLFPVSIALIKKYNIKRYAAEPPSDFKEEYVTQAPLAEFDIGNLAKKILDIPK